MSFNNTPGSDVPTQFLIAPLNDTLALKELFTMGWDSLWRNLIIRLGNWETLEPLKVS